MGNSMRKLFHSDGESQLEDSLPGSGCIIEDPRSPTDRIHRTPIVADKKPYLETDVDSLTPPRHPRLLRLQKEIDPRSPSSNIDRTPISFGDDLKSCGAFESPVSLYSNYECEFSKTCIQSPAEPSVNVSDFEYGHSVYEADSIIEQSTHNIESELDNEELREDFKGPEPNDVKLWKKQKCEELITEIFESFKECRDLKEQAVDVKPAPKIEHSTCNLKPFCPSKRTPLANITSAGNTPTKLSMRKLNQNSKVEQKSENTPTGAFLKLRKEEKTIKVAQCGENSPINAVSNKYRAQWDHDDTQEIHGNGISHTGYNLHVNGVFHCTVRYRQLFTLYEQIKKEFSSICMALPRFPPKKLLPLSIAQLGERRLLLEKYIQALGQNSTLSSSELFHNFLLNAQQATSGVPTENITLDVFLTNGLKIPVNIQTNLSSDKVLLLVCEALGLSQDLVSYFCLFLEKIEDNGDFTLQRWLQEFESPYISLSVLNSPHRIVVRKNYWGMNVDLILMTNRVALNLLYLQTVSDVERGWVVCTKEDRHTLATLQSQGAKRQYMELARTLKFYGYLQFKPCDCDYPYSGSRVLVAAGNRELNLRVRFKQDDDIRQGCFKVTRIRCWRITTLHPEENDETPTLELSFEYLMAKNKLQWVTISSEQAILMSMCLQSMVEELLDDSGGRSTKSPDTSSSSDSTPSSFARELPSEKHKKIDSKHSVSFNSAKGIVKNECFGNDGIGDDDL